VFSVAFGMLIITFIFVVFKTLPISNFLSVWHHHWKWCWKKWQCRNCSTKMS